MTLILSNYGFKKSLNLCFYHVNFSKISIADNIFFMF